MDETIAAYNKQLASNEQAICAKLATTIDRGLPNASSKIWHAHPVWFLDGNPIVGYSQQKRGIRLMFWSGADFDEPALQVRGGKFKDASIFYQDVSEIDSPAIRRWLKKSIDIQWDYKNIVRRKGKLVRLNSSVDESASSPGKRNTRPASEKKLVESAVNEIVARFAPDDVKLVAAARKWLRKRLPTAHELVYVYRSWFAISYSPTDKGYDGILGIRGDAEGVKLFFNNGTALPDPDKLLQGKGKNNRWLWIERPSTLTRPEIVSLVDASIALCDVPWPDSGHGETCIRSSES